MIRATNTTGDVGGLSTFYPVFVSDSGITTPPRINKTTNYLSYVPSTGDLTAINFNSASDKKLKINITKLKGSIGILKEMNPVSFNWTITGKKGYGLIAQEIEKILPELVNESNGSKSISYTSIFAFLIDAVCEQDEKIKENEIQIKELKNFLNSFDLTFQKNRSMLDGQSKDISE